MSRKILVSDGAYTKLCNIARVLKARHGKAPTFAEVIDYLLEHHGA